MKHDYYPIESLPSWIKLNGVSVNGIAFRKLQADDGTDKGSAIVATEVKTSGNAASNAVESEVILRVPSDLVLSFDFVEEYSKSDRQLREVLEAVGNFGRVGSTSSLYSDFRRTNTVFMASSERRMSSC